MRVSGFTIARNAVKFNYPLVESIRSILPICDEFIVNMGDSEDGTYELIKSIKSSKIRIVEYDWDFSMGKEVLSCQTNLALKECKGDWAFYLQSDEVIHEQDLPKIEKAMDCYGPDKKIDALRFRWFHFYGSYWRYRIDGGWYQKQDRIIRNNGTIESYGDAYAFRRKDGQPLHRKNTGAFIYHYGWVQPSDVMAQRRKNAEEIGFVRLLDAERKEEYEYGSLKRFHPYFGSHPQSMEEEIRQHDVSQRDYRDIQKKYWWHPLRMLGVRYKTGKRIKERIV